MHIAGKEKDILILGRGLRKGLDDTILTAEAIHPINFTQPTKRFELSLQLLIWKQQLLIW